jgi:hypothetical protein
MSFVFPASAGIPLYINHREKTGFHRFSVHQIHEPVRRGLSDFIALNVKTAYPGVRRREKIIHDDDLDILIKF